MAFWLMKSEPDAFSIEDLAGRPGGLEPWSGVRNYQARNFMRDDMEIGDHAFFYHSSCAEPGVVGLMRIATRAYPDPTQFDRKSPYYDPKSTQREPRWFLVDVRFERRLARTITLTELRAHAKQLQGLPLLARGSRLSVMPVRPEHWDYLVALENA
jgi:predicted RNA-binding protein with PUA-like domain